MRAGSVVLVDTGPLVALFDPSDADHATCRETLEQLDNRELLSSLAVVTEATYLLDFSIKAQEALLRFLAAGTIQLVELDQENLAEAALLMRRYADLPMDFADATLVVLAGKRGTRDIFTLDRRDFSVYRVGRSAFRLLPEH